MESPKEQFMKGKHAKAWVDASASAMFTEAGNLALLQYAEQVTPGSNEPSAAMANHYRLEGARQFLRVLTNLAIKAEAPKREAPGQLDHRA